jgi:hypothetical protein
MQGPRGVQGGPEEGRRVGRNEGKTATSVRREDGEIRPLKELRKRMYE